LAKRAYADAIYATLVASCLVISGRLLSSGELSAALASLGGLERTFLVIGSSVIAGCFFAGQSVGYRGVFLLMVVPGVLAISRIPNPNLRKLGIGTSSVVVLLMWANVCASPSIAFSKIRLWRKSLLTILGSCSGSSVNWDGGGL
jgi:hypothetical protein